MYRLLKLGDGAIQGVDKMSAKIKKRASRASFDYMNHIVIDVFLRLMISGNFCNRLMCK